MKKERLFGNSSRKFLPVSCRHKKILYSLLIVIFLQTAASGYSQSLSFSVKETPLETVLDKIEQETNYSFLILDDAIDTGTLVSIEAKNENIKKTLDKLFPSLGIRYRIVGKQIILTVAPQPAPAPPQGKKQITGTVVFETGSPVVGAAVMERGTANAVITDPNGNFTLTVSERAVLIVSYAGYSSRQIATGNQMAFRIVITEETQTLDEVVVVGYGVQRRATLTGAVSSVSNRDIVPTRNENVVNMLAGKLPGVRITQKSSQPGYYDTSIDIRGLGSPLVVIDGIPRSQSVFSRMSSEEIESVSVLKDASAAVYGVRSANGVLLVTTKTGKDMNGKVDISYTGNFAVQKFIRVPQTVGVLDYMELKNEQQWIQNFSSNYLSKQAPYWSDDAMQEYRDGKEAYNWYEKLFRSSVPQQEHNLSVTGGNSKMKYFFNLGYLKQDGSLRSGSINYDRWNMRYNVTANITNRLKAEVQLGGYMDNRNRPYTSTYNVYKFAWVMRPTVAFYANDNPNYLNNDPFMPETINILAVTDSDQSGYYNNKGRAFMGTLRLTYDIPGVDGLSIGGSYNYDAYFSDNTTLKRTYEIYSYDEATDTYKPKTMNTPAKITRTYSLTWSTLMQLSMNYEKSFGDHNVSGALIFEESYKTVDGFSAARELKVDSEYLFAGEEENQKATAGTIYDISNKSVIGRFTYNFRGKYLAEFAFRQDGSSRFPKGQQWGFFPSYFLGWRISEEPFVKDNIDFLTNLKIRGSYGVMGDDSSASYYPSTIVGYSINNNLGWFFDEKLITGVSPTAVPNPNLTWYTSQMLNAGIDFDLWDGKLSGSFDVFRRDRSGLLAYSTAVIPGTVGASLPKENLESDRTFGWEIVLGHRNNWRGLNYFVSAQLSATQSRWIEKIESPAGNSYDYWRNRNSGRNKNIWWGYEAVGQYQNFDEIWNSATSTSSTTLPGDWYYLDWNGDGVIDASDNHPIATKGMPMFNYGVSIGATYRNWDLTMNFQGSAGIYVEYGEAFRTPLSFEGGAMEQFYDRWHPADTNADYFSPQTEWVSGYYPVTGHDTGQGTAAIQNASYVRLKTLEIGYSIPRKILARIGMKTLRVYFSGYNLITFTGLKFTDPERPTSENATIPIEFYNYPNNQTFNFGVNIKF